MTESGLSTPKVFISYSWKPIENKERVLKIAERLTSDGVHVIIDEWDLKEGHDKYMFMEQMVTNPEVARVLLACNKDYKEKANAKKGGVGVESLIVSNDIYSKADQTKFIPIILEYDEVNQPCTPVFVNSRIFVDLSNDEIFEENYEKLVRNIFNKPASERPPLGTPPAYIQSDGETFLPTAHKISALKNALLGEKKNYILFVQDYLDSFIESLKLYEINVDELNQGNYDDLITQKIDALKILRDDFINFLETYLKYSISIDMEKMHLFFEKILEYLFNLNEFDYPENTFGYLKDDHFRFFYEEIFLYYSTALIVKGRFNELAYTLNNPFFINNFKYNQLKNLSFIIFKSINRTLENRNKKLNLNKTSLKADIIKERLHPNYTFEQIKQSDVLLYYISKILNFELDEYLFSWWFPDTSCYGINKLSLMEKAISLKHFENIKCLFDVTSIDELRQKVKQIQRDNFSIYFRVPKIELALNIDKLGTLK